MATPKHTSARRNDVDMTERAHMTNRSISVAESAEEAVGAKRNYARRSDAGATERLNILRRSIRNLSALSLSILMCGVASVQSARAFGGPLPIKKIGIDQDHQVVIYFGKHDGEFPSPPHLLETPGPNHRITLEFSDAIVDKINMPAPADLSAKLHKLLPAIKSVRYGTVEAGDVQKARVVIELPEQLVIKPRVVKLEEDSVTIKLADDIVELGAGIEEQHKQAPPVVPSVTVVAQKTDRIPAIAPVQTPTSVLDRSFEDEQRARGAQSGTTRNNGEPRDTESSDLTIVPIETPKPMAKVAMTKPTVSVPTVPSLRSAIPYDRTVATPGKAPNVPSTPSVYTASDTSTDSSTASASPISSPIPSFQRPSAPRPVSHRVSVSAPAPMPARSTQAQQTAPPAVPAISAIETPPPVAITPDSAVDKSPLHAITSIASATESTPAFPAAGITPAPAVVQTPPAPAAPAVPETPVEIPASATPDKAATTPASAALQGAPIPAISTSTPLETTPTPSSAPTIETPSAGASTNSASIESASSLARTPVATPISEMPAAQPSASPIPGASTEIASAVTPVETTPIQVNPESTPSDAAAPSPDSAAKSNTIAPAPVVPTSTPPTVSSIAGDAVSQSTNASPEPVREAKNSSTAIASPSTEQNGGWDWTSSSTPKAEEVKVAPKKDALVASSLAAPTPIPVARTATASTATAPTATATQTTKPPAPTNVGSIDITQIKAEAELPKQVEQPIDDGRPKIKPPVETVTEERFSQPAQVVSAASGTSITAGAAEMLKPKPSEEKKQATVADTDSAGFADVLAAAPKQKAKPALSATELFQGAAVPGASDSAKPEDAGKAETAAAEAPTPTKTEIADAAPSGDDIVKNVIAAAAAEREQAAKRPAAPQSVETPLGQAPSQASIQAAVKLYNAAVNAHFAGKLAEAIAYYKGALAANPTLAEAHSNLGLIYNQQHHYAEAVTEFRKALAINPKDAITYNGVGAALRAQRDLIGAIKNWQTAVSLEPKLATAHYNLGTAYELQKDYDRAFNSYLSAVKNDQKLGDAYYRLGILMVRKHRMQEAQDYFIEALKSPNAGEYAADAKQRLKLLQASSPKSPGSPQTY